MSLIEQKSLEEIRESTIRMLSPHIQDQELLKLVVTRSLSSAVIETKRLCESSIMESVEDLDDIITVLERVELAVPTSSVSTDLLCSYNKRNENEKNITNYNGTCLFC